MHGMLRRSVATDSLPGEAYTMGHVNSYCEAWVCKVWFLSGVPRPEPGQHVVNETTSAVPGILITTAVERALEPSHCTARSYVDSY